MLKPTSIYRYQYAWYSDATISSLLNSVMIFGQLPGRSPEGKTRSLIKSINHTPLYHMNCLQLSKLRLHYDDVLYQNSHVSKIILIGTSVRGTPMLNLRVKDSTGKNMISFYHSEETEALCRDAKGYVKMCINAKCAGMVYKPQLKLMGVSMVELTDFNELTSHCLQCMRTNIKTL